MFSGIVEGLGKVMRVTKEKDFEVIEVDLGKMSSGLKKGDSVAVNGVCLTITKKTKSKASFDVMKETLKKTDLGELKKEGKVNIERPMKLNDRIGGHFVLGHVDCKAKITEKKQMKENCVMKFRVPKKFSDYLVDKGSVALDGISLTLVDVKGSEFSVWLIPHTLEKTTLGFKKKGDYVNVEFDYLAKLVKKMV